MKYSVPGWGTAAAAWELSPLHLLREPAHHCLDHLTCRREERGRGGERERKGEREGGKEREREREVREGERKGVQCTSLMCQIQVHVLIEVAYFAGDIGAVEDADD